MKKLLLFILLFPIISQAQVTIDTSHFFISSTATYKVLGAPRDQICLLSDSGKIVTYQTGFRYSDDLSGDPIWDDWWDTTITYNGGPLDFTPDHGHLYVRNDTIWFVGRTGTSGDNTLVTCKILVVGGQITMIDYDTTWTDDYSITAIEVGSMVPIPGSDTTILITGNDLSTQATDVLSFVSSTGDMNDFGDSIRVGDYSDANMRLLLTPGGNTVYSIVDSTTEGVMSWKEFNKSTLSWDSKGTAFEGGGGTRGYVGIVIEDTIQFCATITSGTPQRVKYAFKLLTDSDFYEDSIQTSAEPYASSLYTIILTYIESSRRLVLTYPAYSSADANSLYMACRYFDWSDSTWSDEYIITQNGTPTVNASNVSAGHRVTPSVWGDQYFVEYRNSSNEIYLAQIVFSESETDNTAPDDFDSFSTLYLSNIDPDTIAFILGNVDSVDFTTYEIRWDSVSIPSNREGGYQLYSGSAEENTTVKYLINSVSSNDLPRWIYFKVFVADEIPNWSTSGMVDSVYFPSYPSGVNNNEVYNYLMGLQRR